MKTQCFRCTKCFEYLSISVILAAVFSICVLAPMPAYALEELEATIPESKRVEGYGAMISPFSVEYELDWEETVEDELIIQNPTENQISYKLSVIDFGIDENGEVVTYEYDEGPYSIRSIVTLETEQIELEPGQGVIMKYEVTAPLDAEAGDHYGYVKVSSSDLSDDDAEVDSEVGTGVQFFPAVVLSVKVAIGEEEVEGELAGMRVEKNFYHNPPVRLELSYENTGNVAYDPEGHISITNAFGKKVAEIPVEDWRIYRNSERVHFFEWDAKWGIGPYKAIAAVSKAGTEEYSTLEVSFWVFPWKWVLAVVFIFLILALILKQFRFNPKSDRKPASRQST
ncbi:MAG: hypothetical protein U9Q67_04865 [Patescibacteria group bacterium]|nr:hypothetical protein [Patescibacteria group bacterium]